jgi:hypothetical protein
MKLPAFQFYPADWRKDPGIQALSRHDRSVWFDLLCIMHESDERGVLLLAGKPIPEEALARMLNLDNQEVKQTLSTLLTYGVASRREEDGAIYSRRMVNDQKTIEMRRNAGKQGGNPVLLKQVDNQEVNQKPTTGVKQKPTPSSSSSTSSSDKRMAKPSIEEISQYGLTLDPPFTRSEAFHAFYESNGWKIGKNPMKDWKATVRTWQQKEKQITPPKTRPLFDEPTYRKNGTSTLRPLFD